jgi:hypothetical protein
MMYPEEGVEVYAQFVPVHHLDTEIQHLIVYRRNNRWYPKGGFPVLQKCLGWTPLSSIRLMYKANK